VVSGSHEFNLSSCILCWHAGHGLFVSDSSWGTVCGNNIIDSGSYNPGVEDQTMRFSEIAEEPETFSGVFLEKAKGYNLCGNNIFNWPQASRMDYGIFEDAEGFKNNINCNNINYYRYEAVLSNGKGSLEKDNTVCKEPAHKGIKGYEFIQSFQPELTEQFLKLNLGEQESGESEE
jgi:hypothetical protein